MESAHDLAKEELFLQVMNRVTAIAFVLRQQSFVQDHPRV